jgi:hypothetical protein
VRYQLRTLLIFLTIGPPLLASAWLLRVALLPALAALIAAVVLGLIVAAIMWATGF